MFFIVLTLMLGSLFSLVSKFRFFQELRIERARCKRTAKAREYQMLMKSIPDAVWPAEIYSIAFNF